MKRLGRIALFAVFTLVIVLTASMFVACDKDAKEKQVPVYKGMTISQSFASAAATAADDGEYVEPTHEPGHVEGDHEHRNDDFDQNKPFENPNTPSIENKASSTLDVVGAAQNIYYADKNQDIYITIKLSNPDSYEILSFTLNGKKYSNYMFEDGSDMENLVLKVNVGNVGGIVEYTIDAIKYVDGTDIKDVRMDGDKTVKAGVRASDQTYVTVTNEQKTMTSISFDAQVVDSYSLIEKSGGYAKAVLYDGETMIAKDVTVGEKASVVFDNLTPNTVYQYGVVALYDDLSGNGVQLNTLYKKAVYTDTIVLFKDVQVGKESISWNFEWNQSFANKQMNAISLWQNGAKVQDVDVNATSVDGLKSNNEYTLKATYKNIQDQDETIEILFVTYAKAVPSVAIENVESTQTGITFGLNIVDTDNVGAIGKIELLHGNDTPIVATDLATRSFANLFSNNDYTIRVTYNYDVNDGVGEQQIVKTADIKTKAKATPSVAIENVESTQTGITFGLNIVDTDNVGAIGKIELLHGNDTPIVATDLATRSFANLFSNNDYTIRVTYNYDVNDGVGEQQIVKTADIKTKAKATPTASFDNIKQLKDSISGSVNICDIDATIQKSKLTISNYIGEIEQIKNASKFDFEGLNCFQYDYDISLTLMYNLNDGKGEQQIFVSYSISTLVNYSLLEDNTYSVTGFANLEITELELPEKYRGKTISTIGDNAFSGSNITIAVLADTIKKIEDNAFKNCYNLSRVNMPTSIRHIGVDAFDGCDRIVNYIKDNITSNVAYNDTSKWYMLKNSIQIKYGATLTINEGVVLLGNNCDIANYGTLNISGTKSDNVTLFNVNLLSKNAGDSSINNFNFTYANLHVGQFSPASGNAQSSNINIDQCSFYDSTKHTYIHYPGECVIKNSYFENWFQISIGTTGKVSIIYNTFVNCGSYNGGVNSVIECWAAYGDPITVQYNNFINPKEYTLSLEYGSSHMDARYNWFGTSDEAEIRRLIWDGNDDFSIPNTIDYSGYLTDTYQSE